MILSVYRHSYKDYLHCQQDMRDCAYSINKTHHHQLWLVEHQSVFTLGQAADRKHLLNTGDIPVVQSNRGGQVSWHGPGQIVIYVLLHLGSLAINVRQLVTILEQSVIALLADCDILAYSKADAPGVYVDNKKIASIGLRISRGVSYHGVSFNFDCSLEPFSRINTCGYPNLEVTRLIDLYNQHQRTHVENTLCDNIARLCGLSVEETYLEHQ